MKRFNFKSPGVADVRNAAILLAVAIALWVPRLTGPIDLRYDGGVYYILGTSIAQGEGYRLLNEPGNLQAVQYPPLLPAIVAAHQWALRASSFAKPRPVVTPSPMLTGTART